MNFRADLHIHTVLSPCGDLEMSPANIIRLARGQQLDIIGITDHNSTRQAGIIRDLGQENGIFVLTGVEITTQEEAHCLAFFPDDERLDLFQDYLDAHLPFIPNKAEKFGYQVVADAEDRILYEEEKLLITALDQDIEKIEKQVRQLSGIFIPAHIDKSRFSILSQLGFIPPLLKFDALEISRHTTYDNFITRYPEYQHHSFIQSSDAHYPEEIGQVYTLLQLEELTFEAIRKALQDSGNRFFKRNRCNSANLN